MEGAPSDDVVASMVRGALPGWAALDAGTIKVESSHGAGQMYTFKVSAAGGMPPTVAVHWWSEEAADDAIVGPRTAAAAHLFAAGGFGPACLAEGGDWFVEMWEGNGLHPTFDTEEQLVELGELLAQMHCMTTDWFEPWRERLCERTPSLRSVPPGSHVWSWTSRHELLTGLTEECQRVWLSSQFFAPLSAAGSKVVTAHSDLHPENMLQTERGIRVIDFEWACVSTAAHDLAPVLHSCCQNEMWRKRALLKAYLHALGQATDDNSVEALLFDAEVAFLGSHMGPLELWIADEDEEKWLDLVRFCATLCQDLRSSAGLRGWLLEQGLARTVKELKCLCAEGCPVVLCSPRSEALTTTSAGSRDTRAVHERFIHRSDGTVALESRSNLVLGASEAGCVQLVEPTQPGVQVLRFALRRRTASADSLFSGGATELSLVQPEGLRLVPGLQRRRAGQLEVVGLRLGNVSPGLSLVLDGATIACGQDPKQVLHAGDMEYELKWRENRGMYDAAKRGDTSAVKAFIVQGADVNFEREEDTLGHVAAREGYLPILDLLLESGYHVNTVAGVYGGSALIEAVQNRHIDCVRRLLLVPGIDLTLQEDEKTAWDYAQEKGCEEIIQLLAKAGAGSVGAA